MGRLISSKDSDSLDKVRSVPSSRTSEDDHENSYVQKPMRTSENERDERTIWDEV